MKKIRNIKIFIALILLLYTHALAKDVNFEATVDRNKIGLGQSLQLNLTFDGSQNMPAPELSAIDGFQVRYLGPSTRMSIINGQASSSVTYVYTLLPTKVGMLKLGPFKFEYNADTYNAGPINIEVLETADQAENSFAQEEQPRIKELGQRIFLTMRLKKDKIYLNELDSVVIKLYVNKLGVRDIQFPQFNYDGFSVGKFETPRQYQEVVGGINYEVIEFQASIFGLRPGEFRLGPAAMQCNLVMRKQVNRRGSAAFDDFFNADVFDNFFGQYQSYPMNLKSTDIPVVVLPLPEENRPEGFSGALGVFDFQVEISPREAKVGDPITLKATVQGQGNFNTVNLPGANLNNDFKVCEPQVKQDNGVKTFEEVLIPLNASVKEIPAISFSFFNTRKGLYETITRGPFPVSIIKPEKEEEFKITEGKQPAPYMTIKEEKLGADIIYIKDKPGELRKKRTYLYQNKVFLWFQIIPFLFYLLIASAHARNRKLATDVKYARQLLAPRKAKAGILRARGFLEKGSAGEFYDTLFAVLQEYLGNKFHLSSKGITISIIDEQLRHKNIPEEILVNLRNIFSECDMVRYAASRLTKENMQNSLKRLEEIIDYLQRNRV
ncbi:MAG: BatD family protein [Candidatus Omnitrophota bacterium]